MSIARNNNLFLDSENHTQQTFPNKQFNSERKHNIRKHALGEIKNVIHNHATTPFKGLNAPGPSKNFCADLLKQKSEQLKSHFDAQQRVKVDPVVTVKSNELNNDDLPTPRKCTQNCGKSLEVIWSEMNVLEPDVLERLINGDGDIENDFDLPERNLPLSFDFEDELDFQFEVPNFYELENKKMLEKILSQDLEFPNGLPVAEDWMDNL